MNIKELAEQAGIDQYDFGYMDITKDELEKFAELVENAARKDEREECAKICDHMDSISDYYTLRVELICAQAIRGRSKA